MEGSHLYKEPAGLRERDVRSHCICMAFHRGSGMNGEKLCNRWWSFSNGCLSLVIPGMLLSSFHQISLFLPDQAESWSVIRKACPVTKQGLLDSSVLSLQPGCVRPFEGTLINSFHEAKQHKGLGMCVGGREANFISVWLQLSETSASCAVEATCTLCNLSSQELQSRWFLIKVSRCLFVKFFVSRDTCAVRGGGGGGWYLCRPLESCTH